MKKISLAIFNAYDLKITKIFERRLPEQRLPPWG